MPRTGRRRPLWRACDRRHDQPWWFSTRTGNPEPGRFDLQRPRGTCYWALSSATAIIEKIADPDQDDPPVVSVTALARLVVWRADRVGQARSKLADTTVASIPGLTGELATIVPDMLAWQWADAFDAAGHNGILYQARFARDECVALFGPDGAPEDAPPAEPTPVLDHYDTLPPGFRAGIGTVGAIKDLTRAPPP
ncbi:MAG: RES family NAD+ phosphorylase [Egibacteraceae bacterium]